MRRPGGAHPPGPRDRSIPSEAPERSALASVSRGDRRFTPRGDRRFTPLPSPVDAQFHRVDAREVVVEAERSTSYGAAVDVRRRCAARAIVAAQADEHVLSLDAPVLREGPFDAAADGTGGDGFVRRGGDQPVAAPRCGAGIDDGGSGRHKSGAALHVDEYAVERIADAARSHGVPVADLCVSQDIQGRLPGALDSCGIKSLAIQANIPNFAFKAEHEGCADRLPIAAEGAAANETTVQIVAPGMSAMDPRCSNATRKRAETGVAEVGEGRIAVSECAANEAADIAAGPGEGRRRRHRRRLVYWPPAEISGNRRRGEHHDRNAS